MFENFFLVSAVMAVIVLIVNVAQFVLSKL